MSGPLSADDAFLSARRLHENGRLDEASALYRTALEAAPAHVEAMTLLGMAQAQQGNLDEASRLLTDALALAPDEGWIHFHLGQVCQGLGRLEDAVASYERAIALLPGQAQIHIRRATLLRALGRAQEALAGYERALAMESGKAAAWYGRGLALAMLDRLEEALPDFERAVSLDPGEFAGQLNLGAAYEQAGYLEKAAQQFAAVAGLFRTNVSQHTRALNEAARVLVDLERYDEAQDCLRQSLLADPTQEGARQDVTFARQMACAWPVAAPFGPITADPFMAVLAPLEVVSISDDPMLQLALNARYAGKTTADTCEVWPTPSASAAPRRLRIGYISADYRGHPVPHLMYDVYGLHDRARFEVHTYSIGPKTDDPLYWHVREQSDHFTDIADLDDAAACQRIVDDGIDILVDLNGHTLHARPGIFARRPAPVIVNWLGYPGTMGSAHHHYILADDWIIPAGDEPFYSEKVLRLPCYQPNPRRRIASEPGTRAEAGLPEDAFVFCCFNTAWKITPESFERWMVILRAVENSVLWLLVPKAVQDRLRAHASAAGVDGARLIFRDRMPNPDHLASHALADLFLDTAPYGAHTTCSDALWMGLPVVTLSGRSFASRVCGSLVRNAGLPELVFTSDEDFVAEAIAIAQSPERLSGYKERLAAARDGCTLFDIDGHVHRLEALYEEMWGDYLSGHLRQPSP